MILSIDVGIRNLAMCLLDNKNGDNEVIQWDVSGVPPQHADGLFRSLCDHLDERPWILGADTILIEKQPDKNRKMKTVENFLQTYFIIKGRRDASVIIYDARHKVPDVAGPGKARYRQRKLTSIARCKEFLENSDVNRHWLEDTFNKSKKKDDLADTVMQALSYTKRIEVTRGGGGGGAATKKAEKKLTSRKPNEHQKDTRYSVSNLVWFCKNTKDHEDLKKNKRFMKDLSRYYTSLDELTQKIGVPV